jgi:hypothetical protein
MIPLQLPVSVTGGPRQRPANASDPYSNSACWLANGGEKIFASTKAESKSCSAKPELATHEIHGYKIKRMRMDSKGRFESCPWLKVYEEFGRAAGI